MMLLLLNGKLSAMKMEESNRTEEKNRVCRLDWEDFRVEMIWERRKIGLDLVSLSCLVF